MTLIYELDRKTGRHTDRQTDRQTDGCDRTHYQSAFVDGNKLTAHRDNDVPRQSMD